MSAQLQQRTAWALSLVLLSACGGSHKSTDTAKEPAAAGARETPPAPTEAKNVSLPPVATITLPNGLQVNTITDDKLPLVYAMLVVQSGAETDPQRLPGLSQIVAQMLKEGTAERSSAALAEEVEFLGADLWTHSNEESTEVGVRALEEHFPKALSLLGEVALEPSFNKGELDKLKRRELDRLALAEREPQYIARRTLYRELYGRHPYSRIDTTPEAVERVGRPDLVRWHRDHVVAKNAFLVVVGNVTPAEVEQEATKVFGEWRAGSQPSVRYAKPPKRSSREIIVVDRPGSVQSVIYLANLAIERANPDWVPLLVANQVLGGSAASRLFMDLREKQSLTYGAYSAVSERPQVAPFVAYASVRTEVTEKAVAAFFKHLDSITTEAAPPDELANAKRYLSDSFPLRLDTSGQVADLLVDLRLFGLPDHYWDTFRENIRGVGAEEAFEAARAHIRPDHMVVVIVGQAADFAPSLRRFGAVKVVGADGEVKARFGAMRAKKGATH